MLDREGILEVWGRVWVESRAVSMGPRLSGNDVIAEMTSAEMTTDPGSEVKNHFI